MSLPIIGMLGGEQPDRWRRQGSVGNDVFDSPGNHVELSD